MPNSIRKLAAEMMETVMVSRVDVGLGNSGLLSVLDILQSF